MIEKIQIISDLWPIVLAFLLGLIWLVRLEAKFLNLKSNYDNYVVTEKDKDKVMWDKFESIQTSLNTLLQSVARLEGKMDNSIHK
jgi:hypothetical protein